MLTLSAIASWKALATIGCMGGAYATYRSMPTPKYRAKLRSAFRAAEIGIKRVSKGKDRKVRWRYPAIRSVTFAADRITFDFVLPNGLDPDVIEQREWVFRQYFGPNIKITGDAKFNVLTVYHKALEKFPYSYEPVQKLASECTVPVYVGKSHDGYKVFDMKEYPHLLVTGETGSGKSTELRSVLTTMILNMPRDKLKLHCVDLKRSEFHLFRGIADSVMVKAAALEKLMEELKVELETRGDLLDEHGLDTIYNLKNPPPTIVLCIDEVALLAKDKEFSHLMDGIEDIGMIGRALGVFLILSMQRADAEVMDGRLKQCLTVRVSFRQPDEINSRIAIGSGEAAQISIKERGKLVAKVETLEVMQAPRLKLEAAKKILEPYRRMEPTPKRKKRSVGGPIIDVEYSILEDDEQP